MIYIVLLVVLIILGFLAFTYPPLIAGIVLFAALHAAGLGYGWSTAIAIIGVLVAMSFFPDKD